MRQRIAPAGFAALLMLSAAGCEHPSEPDESGELRAGIGGGDSDRERDREDRAVSPPRSGERALPPPPGPRTNTPGGVASGLHPADPSAVGGACPSTGETPASPLGSCDEIAPPTG